MFLFLAEEKERLRDKISQATREKMSQANKEKQLQLERKRKAAMFLSMIKGSGEEEVDTEQSDIVTTDTVGPAPLPTASLIGPHLPRDQTTKSRSRSPAPHSTRSSQARSPNRAKSRSPVHSRSVSS